ncbi:MAG: T9SS type A sorting domain-containing protein [Bacteroidia bacterium]
MQAKSDSYCEHVAKRLSVDFLLLRRIPIAIADCAFIFSHLASQNAQFLQAFRRSGHAFSEGVILISLDQTQMNKYSLLLCLFLWPLLVFCQLLPTNSYRDISLPYIELNPSLYNFDYPICADLLDSASFNPPVDGLYLLATYGHRYLSTRTHKTDNHGGFDYWADQTCDGVDYDKNNPIAILCMCDGIISDVIEGVDSVLELTATGRSVQVSCNESFQGWGSGIKINYRHLSALGGLAALADSSLNTVSISKGDTIGIMGASGLTSNVHLHMSTQTTHPIYGSAFVHTARLFDPFRHPNVLQTLQNASIELLQDWPDSALFRIAWPYNQTITRFEFRNEAFNFVFDKEAAYDTGSAIRDNHDCVPGIGVFAYQFNGKQTAFSRYQNEKSNMPAVYPASPQRDGLPLYGYDHHPILNDSIAFVYDFMIKNLPPSHNPDSFKVKLSDVWGYVVEGGIESSTAIENRLATNQDFSLFPNPTQGRLTLSFESSGQSRKIELIDMQGAKVWVRESRQATEELDISDLPQGIYLLRVEAKNNWTSAKVLKN